MFIIVVRSKKRIGCSTGKEVEGSKEGIRKASIKTAAAEEAIAKIRIFFLYLRFRCRFSRITASLQAINSKKSSLFSGIPIH